MKNVKMICTWIFWCFLNPVWKGSLKYRKYLTKPCDLDEIHEHFRNLLSALGYLGSSARDFDDQVKDRLLLILYWVTDRKGMTLDLNKSAQDIMWEINSFTPNTVDDFKIRWNNNNVFKFEYKTNVIDWETPGFPDGTIWGKEMSEENEKLAYLVNILLNGKEVK